MKKPVKLFNKNRIISNSGESTSQNSGEQLAPVVEDHMTRFLKWKVEREKCRKIEQYKRKPPFVIGVVHHKFYSPIVIRGKAHNQAAPMHLVSPKKRVTKATEKRLMNEALTQKVTKGSLKNPNVINKQKKCQKEDEQSVALIDRKFRASGRLLHVPLFGRVVIQNTPVKTNKLKFSSSRKSRVNRKSNIAIFNVKPVNIKENDTSLNDKKSHTDDSEETFNFSNNNSNNNHNKIKSGDENVVHNSGEHTGEEHNSEKHSYEEQNSEKHSNEEHNSGEHSTEKYNEEGHSYTKKVLSSSKNIISASLKSDSPEKLVFFSPYIVSSCGKSNARKEQLKCGFSLDHSSSDDTPTKHTVMKNLNISVEEGDHTAQYFQFFLNKEITRLNELCKTWAEIKIKSETTEDGQYEINQAIGQTNLLLNKKFERCRELVADCETGKGKMLVTCKDLQGLWDMLYMDIMNCDSRFEKLQKLRSRGWKEELPVDKPITKNRSVVRKNVLSTKSSFIRVFLAEKKEKMAQEMRNNDDTKEFEVRDNRILSNKYETNESSNIKCKIRESMCSTPNEKDYAPIGHDKRLSLLKKVHLSETSKKVKSLLTIIKVSQMYKTSKVHLDDTISCVNSDQTPEKSILKPTKSITILESRIKLINKVNFNDRVVLNEVPMDEEMQTKMDLAVILSKTDSFNLDSPDEITINAERKLAFDDNSSEESEIDIRYFKSKNSTIKNISPTIQVPPTTQLLRPELDRNFGIPLPRRSLRRQNALVERNEILYKTSPLEEITDDANLNTLKKKLQKHVSINDKQEISEHDESIEVLKNITVTALCTPIVKRKSLKKVFTSIQESEFKENKTPLERRKKNSLKVSSNDKEKMDLHTWIDNMSLEESNTKRRSIKNVKFFEKVCSLCETSKPVLPMTPHVRRSRAQSSDRKRNVVTENLISWETPEKPPQRIRRSQNKKETHPTKIKKSKAKYENKEHRSLLWTTFGTIVAGDPVDSKYYDSRSHRDVGVKSRLDSVSNKSRTMGVLSRSKTSSSSSSQSTGYRIVVSNLQANVTQEDIKELFEDVGELLVSRLVRPGTAEVIYKTLKDATKAVETYHNRQLDGHSMKCLLVNPRPKDNPTGPAVRSHRIQKKR